MSAPRILISASPDGGLHYENAVLAAGGVPAARYCPAWDPAFDGLLLAGGEDMDPARFGQENWASQGIDPARDEAELELIAACMAAGKPILGICRGHQVLNVALGGTLLQDIGPGLHPFHTHDPGLGRDKIHPIRVDPNSRLGRLYGPICPVNSSHHQAVDRLGEGLAPTAWAESGLVEALEHPSLSLLAVQFHPERMAYGCRRPDAADGSFIFEEFLSRC